MAYIKLISDLPKWFELKNYQIEKEEISAEKFLEQIIYRRALYDVLSNPNFLIPIEIEAKNYAEYTVYDFGSIPYILIDKYHCQKNQIINSNPDALLQYEKIVNFAFLKLSTNPLLKGDFGDLKYDYEFSWVACLREILCDYRRHEIRPIKDMSIYELGEKFTMLPNEVTQYLKAEFKEVHSDKYFDQVQEHLEMLGKSDLLDNFAPMKNSNNLDGISWDYIDSLSAESCMELESDCQTNFSDFEREQVHTHPYYVKPIISIDLSCSDSIIKEQFEKWLNQQRLEINKTILKDELDSDLSIKKTGEILLYKSYTYQILAYIDLCLWCILTNNKIKQSVFTHALFPNGAYDGEFIRKTIRPLVKKLFTPSSKEIIELFALKNMEEFNI